MLRLCSSCRRCSQVVPDEQISGEMLKAQEKITPWVGTAQKHHRDAALFAVIIAISPGGAGGELGSCRIWPMGRPGPEPPEGRGAAPTFSPVGEFSCSLCLCALQN